MSPLPDLSSLPDLAMAPANNFIGAACQRPDDANCDNQFDQGSQGSCANGEICILPSCQFLASRVVDYGAWKNGYCTASCAGSNGHPDGSQCPTGALCSASDREETQQCLLVCTSDADCRSDGYSCQHDGLGAYADQHLAQPRGYTMSCRPDTACARSGNEVSAGFLNQPVPLAPQVLAAAEGNVVFDGKSTAVMTYIGYWVHDGIFDANVVAVACTLDGMGQCTWGPTTANHFTRGTAGSGFVTDPSVAWDAMTGTYWWTWFDDLGDGMSILRVARSTDGGQSWSAPIDVATGVSDKPWIVARGGVVWVAVVDDKDALRIVRSPDDGATWEQHRLAIPGELAFYPQPAVDDAGNYYLAWQGEKPAQTAAEVTGNVRVAMWPAGKPCATLPSLEDCFVGKIAAATTTLFAADRVEDVPMASAFNPSDGSFWVTYISGSRYVESDVMGLRCTPGGQTMACDAPVRISQPGVAQTCGVRILPTIAFDEIGTAHAAWADNRYGAGDRGRIWYATSSDGKTWSESVLSDGDQIFSVSKEWSAGWYGDYMGIVAASGRVIATWSDSRQLPPTGIQPGGFVRQRMFLGVK
jgi:hypothetical protein